MLHWHRMRLLPPAPFVMNPMQHRAKRRLYPEDYVIELGRIRARYPGARLERESWKAFQKDAHEAYNRLVVPLLGGVIPVEVEVLGRGAGVSA